MKLFLTNDGRLVDNINNRSEFRVFQRDGKVFTLIFSIQHSTRFDNFESLVKSIEENKFEVSEEDWIGFLSFNKKLLTTLKKIPKKFEVIVPIVNKYGPDSKQAKALMKLYKD